MGVTTKGRRAKFTEDMGCVVVLVVGILAVVAYNIVCVVYNYKP